VSTLDNFRKEAKRWVKALRAGDPEAVARLRRAHPSAPPAPTLRDVQHALAREHGAESWSALRNRLMAEGSGDTLAPLTQLLIAAEAGDAVRMIELADAHPDVVRSRGTLPGHTGLRTALHFGVHHRDIVRALLERGADPNVRDEGDNAIPLHFAAERSDFDVIRLLIDHGSDPVGAEDDHDLEVMGWLCVFGSANLEIVDYLLAHGSRHNILSAVAIGDVAAIDAIVRGDPAQLNRQMDRTNLRRRPLHLAVVKEQQRSLDMLLELGRDFDLDLDATDAAGLTALDQAALNGRADMTTALMARGATIQLPAAIALDRDEDVARLLGESPGALAPDGRWGRLIVRAGEKSSARVIELLIRHGASVNVRDDPSTAVDVTHGYTALHAAAWAGNLDAIRALLAHGADPRIREEKYCATPAGWAAYAGHTAARDLILEGPVDIFDAITLDRPDLIPRILSNDPGALARPFGAYADCGNGSSDPQRDTTPLAWALMTGKEEAVRMLRGHGADAPPLSRDVISRFLRFACWDHHVHGKGDHEMYAAAAHRMLLQYPAIARDSLYTAIVCGDADEVERILRDRPEAGREPGGERGWPPILYLCFTRLPHPPTIANAVRIATVLLDGGADPNAFYMAGDARYTALVGVAGEGEQDSPRQPQAAPLFQLLLERGANPFDIQVLYNTHFSGEVLWWLELVYEYTKDTRRDAWADPDWSMFNMGGYGPAPYFLLRVALEHDDVALTTWLMTHGANPNATSTHPTFKPRRTLYREAIDEGRVEIAKLLARYGADTSVPASEPDDDERFTAACLRMDRQEIERMIGAHPEYLRHPRAIVAAAHRDRADVVALLLDLGTPLEIEDTNGQRLLHEAAAANAVAVGRLLIDRGAEIDHREPNWNATPFGFAAHGQRREMMDLLSRVTEDIWGLTFNGYVDRVRELLDRHPALARSVNGEGHTLLWWFPADEDRALEIVDLLLAHGADAAHQGRDGTTAGDWARACAMNRVARRLGATGDAATPAASAQVETYDRLARDLVVAFEMGQPDALTRLRDHYGQTFTWQELRASVRQRLESIPAEEKPDGYFALPHARLLIARQAGFASWQALTES
jgi:ankyrin repeat protein